MRVLTVIGYFLYLQAWWYSCEKHKRRAINTLLRYYRHSTKLQVSFFVFKVFHFEADVYIFRQRNFDSCFVHQCHMWLLLLEFQSVFSPMKFQKYKPFVDQQRRNLTIYSKCVKPFVCASPGLDGLDLCV